MHVLFRCVLAEGKISLIETIVGCVSAQGVDLGRSYEVVGRIRHKLKDYRAVGRVDRFSSDGVVEALQEIIATIPAKLAEEKRRLVKERRNVEAAKNQPPDPDLEVGYGNVYRVFGGFG